MTNPLADLPGAPPLADTQAWAPAQSPGGAVPDATPYRAVAIDTSTLTPQQRFEMKRVISSGDRARFEAFAASLQNTSAPGVAPPTDGASVSSTDSAGAEVPRPGFEPDASPMRQAMAGKLEAHGSSIEAVDALADPIDAYRERLLAMPEEARLAEMVAGEQRTIDGLFHGSEGAFKVAMAEIKQAALEVGGEDLIRQIDDSAVLTDPSLFRRVWLMAKSVLGGKAPA